VRLNETVDTILHRHEYPEPVSQLLAELVVLSAMLAANLKKKGILTVQLKGNGPVRFMVVDADAKGHMRGYAQLADDAVSQFDNDDDKKEWSFNELVGEGYLAITLDQGKEPYQGIVEFQQESLTKTIQHYFTNSEQTQVIVRVAVGRNSQPGKSSDGKGQWCAGGIMLQYVPHEGGVKQQGSNQIHFDVDEAPSEQWNRAAMFTRTVEQVELLDPLLSPQDLLYRLFNEDGVWVYEPQEFDVSCRCSREKVVQTLQRFPKEELETMAEGGEITVTCQFCNQTEKFTVDDLY
jgi:molecular chaperone Hsp33